ncbi:hypothetical protein C8R46DRAFT_648519 [Mycena filopes]|nr:hypothetical protein C8R46DRAFT_648519 [Mycena filopes]
MLACLGLDLVLPRGGVVAVFLDPLLRAALRLHCGCASVLAAGVVVLMLDALCPFVGPLLRACLLGLDELRLRTYPLLVLALVALILVVHWPSLARRATARAKSPRTDSKDQTDGDVKNNLTASPRSHSGAGAGAAMGSWGSWGRFHFISGSLRLARDLPLLFHFSRFDLCLGWLYAFTRDSHSSCAHSCFLFYYFSFFIFHDYSHSHSSLVARLVLASSLLISIFQDPSSSNNELTLTGTLLARNAAFEKHVFVRFTLDGWCTTSEVGGRYVESLASFPTASSPTTTVTPTQPQEGSKEQEAPGPNWDRFAFSIRLTDYAGAPTSSGVGSNSRGGAGVGKGLEGRELVLVARFFAPWVGRGGVGPYVWCDTLTTGAGTGEGGGASPSGRAWVGTGGGGSGEWWDNNGGRDYRVGFRVVNTVQEPAPAPAPTVATAPTTVTTPKNDIPFPTTSDSASPITPTPSAPPTSTTTAPAQPAQPLAINTQAIPPPPPPRTAHAQALAAKLGRLSLRNYAAPSAAPRTNYVAPGARTVSFPSGPAAKRGDEKIDLGRVDEKSKVESHEKKEEETKMEKVEEKKEPERSTGGVGLYWPWGRASASAASVAPPTITTTAPSPSPPTTTPSPPIAATASTSANTTSTAATTAAVMQDSEDDDNSSLEDDDLDDDAEEGSIASLASFVRDPRLARPSSHSEEGEGEETPPTSPVGARGALPDVLDGVAAVHGENEKEESKAAGGATTGVADEWVAGVVLALRRITGDALARVVLALGWLADARPGDAPAVAGRGGPLVESLQGVFEAVVFCGGEWWGWGCEQWGCGGRGWGEGVGERKRNENSSSSRSSTQNDEIRYDTMTTTTTTAPRCCERR